MSRKISEKKLKEVEDIKELIKKYPLFGVINLEGLPTFQFQKLRLKFKDVMHVKVTKKRLIKHALSQLKDSYNGIEKINGMMQGMPSLLFTNENPFKIYKILAQNRSKAHARPGQIAPNDIKIPAGPTPFTPGPVISELAQLGLKASVVDGKVNIMAEKVMVHEGEEISPKAADMLQRLGIEPMEVGLNLVLIYENGVIYNRDVLAVDEQQYISNIFLAHNQALALAIEISYMTRETVEEMLKKAFREASHIADSQGIPADMSIQQGIVAAETNAAAISTKISGNAEEKDAEAAVKTDAEAKPRAEEKPENVVEKEKPLKYFKEKGPSAAELLSEIEKEEQKDVKKDEIKEIEDLAKKIFEGNSGG
jgi:large subunit ribosomal protein L10